MSEQNQDNVLKIFNSKRIAIAIGIGLVAIFYMLYKEMNANGITIKDFFSNIADASLFWMLMAFVVLILRDGGYMYRIRNLTSKKLSWKSSFYVVLLWEFASALTPSVVGGAAIAIFILSKEKIPFGKSLAYVMLTTILDNLFFVLAALWVLLTTGSEIFPETSSISRSSLQFSFYFSYALIALYVFIMAFGLFISPRSFKKLLMKITSWKIFRRLRKQANEQGTQMLLASEELKTAKFSYWFKASVSTLFIWIARYFMLNCLIAAFSKSPLTVLQHQQALAQQVIMWIAQLISPTPGASGVAEGLFKVFFESLFATASISIFVAFLWRTITHIAYLLTGAFVIKKWLKRVN